MPVAYDPNSHTVFSLDMQNKQAMMLDKKDNWSVHMKINQ